MAEIWVFWHYRTYSYNTQHKLDIFQTNLRKLLEFINKSGFEAYLAGDLNVDFYKYNDDKQTSEYLDMLLSHGFIPLITKARRITHHT